MADCINALKEWTGKARATIVFDSTVDEFTADGLFDKLKGKRNITIVGFTTDGDVFGGFYSIAVMQQDKGNVNLNVFVFSFESHGRCKTPQRFVLKEDMRKKAIVGFWRHNSGGFVDFWVERPGHFWLGNEKSNSPCDKMSRAFEGLVDTTLTGKTSWSNPHHCNRLVAIQLE